MPFFIDQVCSDDTFIPGPFIFDLQMTLAGTIFYFVLNRLSLLFSTHHSSPVASIYALCPREQQVEWHLRVPALINGFLQALYYTYLFFSCVPILELGTLQTNKQFHLVLSFCMGYFIYDSLMNIYYLKLLRKNDVIYHHILVLITAYTQVSHTVVPIVLASLTLWTDVLSHFRWLHKIIHPSSSYSKTYLTGYRWFYTFVFIIIRWGTPILTMHLAWNQWDGKSNNFYLLVFSVSCWVYLHVPWTMSVLQGLSPHHIAATISKNKSKTE